MPAKSRPADREPEADVQPDRSGAQDGAPWWYERFATLPSADAAVRGSGLLPLLQRLPSAELVDIARQRGWTLKHADSARRTAELAERMEDPTEVAKTATALPEQLKAALRAALVAEDGSGITATGLANAMTATGAAVKPVEAAGLLRDLARYGLTVPWRDPPGNGHHYLLPWDIQKSLPPLAGWCKLSPECARLEVRLGAGSRFLDLMYRVWRHILEHPARLRPPSEPGAMSRPLGAARTGRYGLRSDRGRPGAGSGAGAVALATPAFLLDDSSMSDLSPLADGDSEQIEFACRMLAELEMTSDDTEFLRARPAIMERFLLGSSSQRCAILVHAYVSMVDWNELDALLRADPRLVVRSHARHPSVQHELRSQLVRLRQILLRVLATAGDEGWCALRDIDAALHPLWSDLAQLPQSGSQPRAAQVWHLAWRHDLRPLSPDRTEDWEAAQTALLRIVLEGPLHWLGIADLSYRGRQLAGLHLHGLADLIWDRAVFPETEQLPGEVLEVDSAHLTLSVRPSAISAQGHAVLGRMACLERTAPLVFVYRLDQRMAYAAFERGETLNDLLTAWGRALPVPIPVTIEQALTAWWTAYGQVRLYEGLALLEVGDDLTLRELEVSTSLSRRVLARLSPRQVLVSEKAVPILLQEFAAKGLTPKESR